MGRSPWLTQPKLKLYTYPGNKNAYKALIAAEYVGAKMGGNDVLAIFRPHITQRTLMVACSACTAVERRLAASGAGGNAGSKPHGATSTSSASARSTGPVPTAWSKNWRLRWSKDR